MATQPSSPVDPLLVVILGPTASGKSALAISLAERFFGEIVSCDSVAVYRDFEIGTAKPPREDRARIPHHLIDVAEPNEAFTAANMPARHAPRWRDSQSVGIFPSWLAAPAFTCGHCWKGCSPVTSAPTSFANGCAHVPANAPYISIAYCAGLIPRLR